MNPDKEPFVLLFSSHPLSHTQVWVSFQQWPLSGNQGWEEEEQQSICQALRQFPWEQGDWYWIFLHYQHQYRASLIGSGYEWTAPTLPQLLARLRACCSSDPKGERVSDETHKSYQ